MPEISRFFGIVIYLYFQDHAPPHFHARYGDDQASIEIRTRRVMVGRLPKRASALVIEWAVLNEAALLEDWERAAAGEALVPIAPLV
jgi:uncharacterized protein DUF4160